MVGLSWDGNIWMFDEISGFSTKYLDLQRKDDGVRSFTVETKRYGDGIGTTRNFGKIIAKVLNDIEIENRGV